MVYMYVSSTEPKAESILIDDDDDDDDGNADGRRQDYRGAPQASPSHTLWYKMPHGPKPRTSLRHRLGKQHSDRKCYSNPHIVVRWKGRFKNKTFYQFCKPLLCLCGLHSFFLFLFFFLGGGGQGGGVAGCNWHLSWGQDRTCSCVASYSSLTDFMLMLNTAAYLLGKPYYCSTSICCAKIYTYVCVCVHVCVCLCVCVCVCSRQERRQVVC